MSPFAHKPFRWMFAGQLLEQLADWFKLIAMLGCVYQLTPSLPVLALVFLISICGRWGGEVCGQQIRIQSRRHWEIRYRLLHIFAMLGVVSGVLQNDLVLICLFLFFTSLLSSLTAPLSSAWLPRMVPEKQVMPAAAHLSRLANLTMLASCLFVAGFGDRLSDRIVLWVSLLLYVASLPCRWMLLDGTATDETSPQSERGYGQKILDGWALIRKHPYLPVVYGLQMARNLCFGVLLVAWSGCVFEVFAAGSRGLGVGYAVVALSFPVGAFVFNRWAKGQRQIHRLYLKLVFPLMVAYPILSTFLVLTDNWYWFLGLLFAIHVVHTGLHAIHESVFNQGGHGENGRTLSTVWQLISRVAQIAGVLLFLVVYEFVGLQATGLFVALICAGATASHVWWFRMKAHKPVNM